MAWEGNSNEMKVLNLRKKVAFDKGEWLVFFIVLKLHNCEHEQFKRSNLHTLQCSLTHLPIQLQKTREEINSRDAAASPRRRFN